MRAGDSIGNAVCGIQYRLSDASGGPKSTAEPLSGLRCQEGRRMRCRTGYIALQAHDFLSRMQFRNLQIKKLP